MSVTHDLVTGLTTIVLGGGPLVAITSWATGKTLARKTTAETDAIEAKTPAEVDSVVVQGAEQAVLSMQRALEVANQRAADAEDRIGKLERERERDRRTIEALRREVAQLRRTANQAVEHATALEARLDEMAKAHDGRP